MIASIIEMMEANTMTAGFEPGPRDPQPFSVPMALVPSYDVIELLPPGATDRLRALRQRFHDLNVLIPKHDVMHEASTARIMAEQRLKRLLAHPHENGFNLKPDHPSAIEQQRLLDKLTDNLKRLNELDETRSVAWRAASHVLTAVESWLKDGGVPPGVMLADIDGKPPQLLKNETVIDAIERLRRRGRELKADLNRIRSAPYPSAHVREKIKQEVETLATRGAPVVSDVIEHDRSVVWPMQRLQGAIINAQVPSFAVTEVPDLLGLFAFVHKEALLSALDALLDAEKDDDAALSHIDREKRLSEVQQDQLAAEYDESSLVWRAMSERLPVEHRSDCEPQAILQVRLVTAPHTNRSGTSPEHAFDIVGLRR